MRRSKRENEKVFPASAVQLRQSVSHPFSALRSYVPLSDGNAVQYRLIREAVPIVDAALMKLVRLCGGFHAQCENEQVDQELNRFISTVNVGRGQRGLQSFLDCYLDSMLTYGSGVGEIVTDGRDIAAVLCHSVRDVVVKEGDSALDFQLCASGMEGKALPYQELMLFTPFHPEPEHPYGVSMLRSMPYLVDVLLTIYESIHGNFERSGTLRYALSYKCGDDAMDRANANERVNAIAREWSRAMQSSRNGDVKDFVALGDVDIKTIGADAEMPDTEMPVRQILEQLVSKTGIPPFMLGLSWSSTERMSAQQADVMTSEIWAIRRSLTVPLERICDLWMAMHGYAEDYEICWDSINLQDIAEEAKADWYIAQTEEIRQKIKEETA